MESALQDPSPSPTAAARLVSDACFVLSCIHVAVVVVVAVLLCLRSMTLIPTWLHKTTQRSSGMHVESLIASRWYWT